MTVDCHEPSPTKTLLECYADVAMTQWCCEKYEMALFYAAAVAGCAPPVCLPD